MSAAPQPEAGFRLTEAVLTVDADEQARDLEACGIDPALFGDEADPANFIGLAIRALTASGFGAAGNVNMLQTVVQHAPVRLGEPLTVSGEIVAVDPVPRGLRVTVVTEFHDADGRLKIGTRRESLRPDPARAGARGAGSRPEPVIAAPEALPVRERISLTPEGVTAYNSAGNPIHYDVAAARAAGFRAPIIAGDMGVHLITAWLWRMARPRMLDMSIFFRRPIFWDDALTLRSDGPEGAWRALALERDGKVATEVRLDRLETA